MKTVTNRVILYILIAWASTGYGQQSFFLDSLFSYDLSQIEAIQLDEQRAQIDRLEHDWGVAAGMNITNSFQDQLDAGLSTRIFAKANLWNGGYHSNRMEAETIKQQIKIDSIQGIDRSIAHNYGIYFDYIIYLYNKERLKQIEVILTDNIRVVDYFRNLYYNKLIDYSELLELENTEVQYGLLRESLVTYNRIFSEAISDTLLPVVSPEDHWAVDFDGLCNLILQDTSDHVVMDLHHEMLDLQYDKQTAPSLSASLGYDVSRSRPFFAVNFSVDIRTHKKQNLEARKLSVANDIRLAEIQKKKEILNIQYEYRYKEKQLSGLYSKVRRLEEQQRQFDVRREVLSLEQSIDEQKIALQKQMIQYEITDLKGQLMLLLLRVKKIIPKMEIGPYIRVEGVRSTGRKYAGNRVFMQSGDTALSTYDTLFLEQNEIEIITPEQLIRMADVIEVDPTEYNTRVDMEKNIVRTIEKEGGLDFIITDLDGLKQLELRTLAQKDFAITARQATN